MEVMSAWPSGALLATCTHKKLPLYTFQQGVGCCVALLVIFCPVPKTLEKTRTQQVQVLGTNAISDGEKGCVCNALNAHLYTS